MKEHPPGGRGARGRLGVVIRPAYRVRMACSPDCVKPTPAQCHCVAECHQTFGGVTMFDKHRRDGRCLDPAECGMTQRNGVWRETLTDGQRIALERLKRQNAQARRRAA